jgi:hypothetical protein
MSDTWDMPYHIKFLVGTPLTVCVKSKMTQFHIHKRIQMETCPSAGRSLLNMPDS